MLEEKTVDIYIESHKLGLTMGRLISGSKSLYHKAYPKHEVYFNANILTEEEGKIWYGDLDITISKSALNKLSKILERKIYVLHEMDCRFENENKDPKELIKKAVWTSK